MAAACSCIQSGLLLIHHPRLCCQLANSVHFCTWNQGNATRNYLSLRKKSLRNSIASRENRRNHFDLSLISIWGCLEIFWGLIRLITSSFGEISVFFWKQKDYSKQWNSLANVTSYSQWDNFFTGITKCGPHTCCFPLCHTWICAFSPDSWPKGTGSSSELV